MDNSRRKLLLNILKLFDLGLMIVAVVAAALVVFHQSRMVTIAEFFSMRVKIQNFAILALFMLVWHLIFSLSGLYNSRRLSSRRGEVIDVMKATSLGTFAILVGATVFRISIATPLFLVVFWLVSTCTNIC